MARVDELIDGLKDFRLRSAAKNELMEMGEEAVPALLAALDSRHASVRWAAASILGELGAKQAATRLVELLDDADVSSAAVEALERITGEQFGEDRDAWKRWLDMGGGGSETAVELDSQTDADLVEKAVYGTDVAAEKRGGGYVFRVPIGDRHQDVTTNFRSKDSEGEPLVVAYTRCGPADPKHFEWALRQNLRMSAGAIAVVDVEGKPEFVIVDVIVRAAATPRLLIETVKRVARKGDQLEAALTKADEH